MKRKKIILIAGLVLALVNIFIVGWLLFGKKDGARSVIPADATLVAEFEPMQLASELNLSVGDIVKLLSRQGGESLGADFSHPTYLFASPTMSLALACDVSDDGKLRDYLTSLGASIEKQRGLEWASLANYMVCFDSHKLVAALFVMKPEQDRLRNEIAALMKQKVQEVPMLADIQQMDGCLKLSAPAEIIPATYTHYLTDYLSDDISLSDVRANITLQVQEKALALNVGLTSDNAKVQQALAQVNDMAGNIQGDLLGVGLDKPLFSAHANLKGDRLLELLRQNQTIRTQLLALNMCVDADMMLRAVDGDVSVFVPKFGLKSPDFLLTAQLDNTDFLRNVDDWKSGLSADAGVVFQVLKDNDFRLTYNNQIIYFGVRDRMLYITPSASLAAVACQPVSNPALLSLKSDMVDCQAYFTLDVAQILKSIAPLALLLGGSSSVLQAAAGVDRVNVKMLDAQHITLEMTSQQRLVDIISQLIK